MKPLSLAILAVWTTLAWSRVPVYSGDLPLWRDAVRLEPQIPRPWNNLGAQLEGTPALAVYRHAVTLTYRPYLPQHDALFDRWVAARNLARMYDRTLPAQDPKRTRFVSYYLRLAEQVRRELTP